MERTILQFAKAELERISKVYDHCPNIQILKKGAVEETEADIILSKNHPGAELEGDAFAIIHQKEKIIITSESARGILYGVYEFCEKEYGYQRTRLNEFYPFKTSFSWPETYSQTPLFKRRSIVIEEIDDEIFLENIISWCGRNGINELFFTFYLWDKVGDLLSPQLAKRGIDVCLGGHSMEFLLNEEKEDLNEAVFTKGESYLEAVIHQIHRYTDENPIIKRISLWPKDKGVLKENGGQFISEYINFTEKLAEHFEQRVEFIAYNAGLSWAMLENKGEYPEQLDLLFAYWGRDYSTSLYEPNADEEKAFFHLDRWLQHKKAGQAAVFEYYSDFFMQSELFPPLAHRITDDIHFYQQKNLDGISNLIVPLKKSLLSPEPDEEHFWKWMCQFNNYAFAKALWGSTEEEIYRCFFAEQEENWIFYQELFQQLEEKLSIVSRYNTAGFPLRIVDDLQLAENHHLLEKLSEVNKLINDQFETEVADEYAAAYLEVLQRKTTRFMQMLKDKE